MSEAIPDSPKQHSAITQQSAHLRAELKEWEKSFAAANGGRKAGREDIKKVPDICVYIHRLSWLVEQNQSSFTDKELVALKYKTYNRLRDILPGKLDPSTATITSSSPAPEPIPQPSKKRKHPPTTHDAHRQKSPRKIQRTFFTPTKSRQSHPSHIDPYDSPSILRRLFSPQHDSPTQQQFLTSIGPTPQRDGKVLGLFDLLSQSGGSNRTQDNTPLARKKRTSSTGNALAVRDVNIAQTPSRQKKVAGDAGDGELEIWRWRGGRHHSRTPVSTGKKFLLSTFFTTTTPNTMRFASITEEGESGPKADISQGDILAVPNQNSESSLTDTPVFLRRRCPTAGASQTRGSGDIFSSGAVRIPGRRLGGSFKGKGLSALVKGLRDMEDERLEDELDVLRQIEAEQEGMVLVGDSQHVPHPLLEAEMDLNVQEREENREVTEGGSGGVIEGEGEKQKPRKIWKKKGQKRTTRRVIMRPVRVKTKAEPMWEGDGSESGDELAADVVAEMQRQQGVEVEDEENGEDVGDDAFIVDEDELPETEDQLSAKASSKTTRKVSSPKQKNAEKGKELQPAKKAAPTTKKRKVNPEAHANYRTLKIKNKNSKGKGRGGRFGRRGR